MLEDQVAFLLQRYLGNYVRGLNKEALKISVWQGDVELTNMQLKPEALNALKLPVRVKAGFLGSIRLKVPWSRLGHDPVLVSLDRIYVLAEPATVVEGSSEDAVREAKRTQIREMEMKLLESRQMLKNEMDKSWLGSLIGTVIGNLKLSISNIHIRYEDLESNPGHPFAAGVTLDKLSAFTIDDNGEETFITEGALEKTQKSVELERMAVYLDSDITPWHSIKPWEDLLPSEWEQIFKFGTRNGRPEVIKTGQHSYVLQPVSGSAKYFKDRHISSGMKGQPLQQASVNLDDVVLCLSKDGYRDLLKLADNFASFNLKVKYVHYRPHVSVNDNPLSWWKYAYRAVSDQMKKARGKLSWEQVLRHARLRKKYISLYASLLMSDGERAIVDDNKEIEEIDLELDAEVILQWRMMAHKFVEQSTGSESSLKKQKSKKSWWLFGRNNNSSTEDAEPGTLTEEDWKRLNDIIGYKGHEELMIQNNRDLPNILLNLRMKHNASKLIDADVCLAELSCDNLESSIKIFSESKVVEIRLGSYRLRSPNGLLAVSGSASDSLVGAFCYKPFDVNVDWSLVAKASPCYVTYLKDCVNAIIDFFQNSATVSQTLARETASAVQMTLDEVKRTTARQVNKALKQRTRFLLDLDIAAPKITIPTEFSPDGVHSTKLLIDLGKLAISSQDIAEYASLDEMNMYTQFNLVLRDVSAFLVDGDYSWSRDYVVRDHDLTKCNFMNVLPVIDKCGVFLKLQQIRSPTPNLPSTRLAMRLPSMGFSFSPSRYHRLMQIAKLFQDNNAERQDIAQPWDEPDFADWLYHLTRRGVGGREAVWQRRYLCIVGSSVYLLENPEARSYKHYFSLRGKQLHQLPSDIFGNVENVFAVFDSEQLIGKVLEDSNALILRCDSENSRKTWQMYIQRAIYRASGTAPIVGLLESTSDSEESEIGNRDSNDLSISEKFFLTGVLDELKITFSYSSLHDQSFTKLLLAEEKSLLEFRAIGGQIEFSIRGNDIFIGTVLKSLEIEDMFCNRDSLKICYLARSFIMSAETPSLFRNSNGSLDQVMGDFRQSEGDEEFYEASESLNDSTSSTMSPGRELELTSSRFISPYESTDLEAPVFTRSAALLPFSINHIESCEPSNSSEDSFVKAQIVMLDQNSAHYSNIDKLVSITVSTLSFYCRRPTVIAIMEFANAINLQEDNHEVHSDVSSDAAAAHPIPTGMKNSGPVSSEVEEPVVQSLLGKGKSRVVFCLQLDMTRAEILLMTENDSKLATLTQDNFLTDIKVFPASFSIKASLGNLKISDDSLHMSHMYFWACDMRNPGGKSFVEVEFSSFSTDDEDYESFDYSLTGQLSEVRIIYLNRFLQEVTSYFMGLVPGSSKEIVQIRDQVTNAKKLLSKSEIEGSPAVKLDILLKNPIIIMPKRTDSVDYLKLDVVQITVENTFRWIGGRKTEIKAVHMEMTKIVVDDIKLNVGSGSELSESIIHDVKGVNILMRRTLRDLFHHCPNIEIAIMIDGLKGALSNKEYEIIIECAQDNISETPNIMTPPKVESYSPLNVNKRDLDNAETEARESPSWIATKVSVSINTIELSLHYGNSRDASLASLQVSGLWLSYKSNTVGGGFLSSTLKELIVLDNRVGTETELRLAIGKLDLDEYTSSQSLHRQFTPAVVMFDATYNENTTTLSLCIQRPQMLVTLDFLLAIAEFFVPAIRAEPLYDENSNSSHFLDPIILHQSIFSQPSSEFSISPQNPLVVDDEKFENFIYDGRGGTLFLKDRHGVVLSGPSQEPLIFVGNAKKLQFRNVIVRGGRYLDSSILLGVNSSYSANQIDSVILEEENNNSHQPSADHPAMPSHGAAPGASKELVFEMQAIGPEFTFYNKSRNSPQLLSNKLLHAQMDVFCRLVMNGDTIQMSAKADGLTLESSGIKILEPFDSSVEFCSTPKKTSLCLKASDIFMNFSFSILKLFLDVEEDILSFLSSRSTKPTALCSEFDRIGTIKSQNQNAQLYCFWRPRAPMGFAILGDYLTPVDKPPTKGVIAVNTRLIRVKRPKSFTLVWPSSSNSNLTHEIAYSGLEKHSPVENTICSVWFPEAPNGYVALGCVTSSGMAPPPISSVFCILESLVSSCGLRDCVCIDASSEHSNLAFWRVDNAIGTFLPADPATLNLTRRAYEIRHFYLDFWHHSPEHLQRSDNVSPASMGNDAVQSERSSMVNSRRRYEAVATFRLIWWNQGSRSRKKISIWRPVTSDGVVYFGDIAVLGYEPPNNCIVVQDSEDCELYKSPSNFLHIASLKKQRGLESISFWWPEAPLGFVSLGCIACRGTPNQADFSSLRCIRADMVSSDQYSDESIWDSSDLVFNREPFSIWRVGSEDGTFIVWKGFKKPSRRFALKLSGPDITNGEDSTVIDAEVRTFSAALFDDYGGLMIPLCNVSLSGIGFSLHGIPDCMHSSVNFSLAAMSYNDKYDSWEPLVEPVDGSLRYQYNPNAPGAASQIRTTSKDLNMNVSVSNVNMVLQAYRSWNKLSNTQVLPVVNSPTAHDSTSITHVHQKQNYYIIPQNKLGMEIFVRTSGVSDFAQTIAMPPGDKKALKVPFSRNMTDSHLKRSLCTKHRIMLTVIVADAEIMKNGGLCSHQYSVQLRLLENHNHPIQTQIGQQRARTRGVERGVRESSDVGYIMWNEVFFFRVNSMDNCMLELTLSDTERGESLGSCTSSLMNLVAPQDSTFDDQTSEFKWLELTDGESKVDGNCTKCGRIRCRVLLPPKTFTGDVDESVNGLKRTGLIQISPIRQGPWTTLRLNYSAPAACWKLGNDFVASEVSVIDGNRYINIRSLVSVLNSTDRTIEICLKHKSAGADTQALNAKEKKVALHGVDPLIIGPLNPGETVPLPLPYLSQSSLYVIHIRPSNLEVGKNNEYAWSSIMDTTNHSQELEGSKGISDVYVSCLRESVYLLCCSKTTGSSSSSSQDLWFFLDVQGTEIYKDVHSNPILDWTISVRSPISVANYLPLAAEISLLGIQDSGRFLCCYRGVFGPGESVKVYNSDIRKPIYISLLSQGGWLPVHEAVLLSHPSNMTSNTISLRSSVSGRIVQIIVEHNHIIGKPLEPLSIKIYSPYWVSIARCPPLSLRFIDFGAQKLKKNPLSYKTRRLKENIHEEITEEEMHENCTVVSALNFKSLGISASIEQSGGKEFGPVTDLSSLGDMDGSLDLYAHDSEGNYMQLFVSSKPCPYQSIPTKIISIRPFMTFTNRAGQRMLIMFGIGDEPKSLQVFDTRVSFVHRGTGEPNHIQVRMLDTDWSFPIQILKEDTIILSLREHDGTQRFLRTEIRGYEEGSRFTVVFRLGSSRGPVRIENRAKNNKIRFRQSGFGDDSWIQLLPLSTKNFSWENPYGQKTIDAEIDTGTYNRMCNFDLDKSGLFAVDSYPGLSLHVVDVGGLKVVRFLDTSAYSREEVSQYPLILRNSRTSNPQANFPEQGSPLEVTFELGSVGISVVDQRPREVSYLYMEKFLISYSTGYDGGTTSRFKLILGYLQLDNQLPLSVMPVLLAPEHVPDVNNSVFKMTITARNDSPDGLEIYPYVYIKVTDTVWRLNIHEPVIWALVDFYNNLQLDRIPQNTSVTQVDPEMRVDLIDLSAVKFKVSLEAEPALRPRGLLGVWGPVLSAVGNAFKFQVHLRKITHKDRFLRKSSVISAIGNRIWRDLIHNPLHLISSVDVLGMTSSTLASLSKGFAQLSTDGQFLHLRSKQVWSRRITGVGDGIVQGTEALAQGVAFGVSGVVRKPIESARENGLLGLAHGIGQAFLGFFVQPMSGALDFFSLTVDGIGASCTRCLEVLSNKKMVDRIRIPRAFRADNKLREYSEREALGQMILYLAETSRNFGCTDIFKEPSKYAWSDCYEEHFMVPYQRIVLVTNKRVMLLQIVAPHQMDKKPCKIMWDVPWEEVMALESAKAGYAIPCHLIIHLKSFKRGESFVRVLKCNTEQSPDETEPQVLRIRAVVRRAWKAHQHERHQDPLRKRRHDSKDHHKYLGPIVRSRGPSSSGSASVDHRFTEHCINFSKIWSSERETKSRCSLCRKQSVDNNEYCSIWRPVCPDGYVIIGDIARASNHPPNVASVYRLSDEIFALPISYDLVWRNCLDDYKTPVSIWLPRAPRGYVSLGCVAVAGFEEPEKDTVYCVAESVVEETTFEEQKMWTAPESYPWSCHVYQTNSDALPLVALRVTRQESDWLPKRIVDSLR